MIKSIKRRTLVDTEEAKRARNSPWGRRIYLVLLSLFGIGILNYVFGPLVLLRADGLVLQKSVSISPSFDARVAKVFVQTGERVVAGAPLVQLESVTLSRSMAELATRLAEIRSQEARIRAKLDMTRSLIPFARQQNDMLAESFELINRMRSRNLTNERRREDLHAVVFTAREKFVQLQSEEIALNQELNGMISALGESELAYNHLKAIFNGGRVEAPVDGIVGSNIVSVGDVIAVGSKAMDLYVGKPYVLTYISDNYLFEIRLKQEVMISSGMRAAASSVERVLPVSDSLPPEFQSTFRPRDRNQVVQVRLPDDHRFSIHQKVRVSNCFMAGCPSLTEAVQNSVSGGLRMVREFARPSDSVHAAETKSERDDGGHTGN